MKKTDDILRLYNIKAKKKFGQNFLNDEGILDDIVYISDITKKDMVIEIGPGIGNLTQRLCEKATYVVAVEIDESMKSPLRYVLKEHKNCSVIFTDVMSLDIKSEIIEKYKTSEVENIKIIANLPYYIATHVITTLLSSKQYFNRMVLMVQKEVAHRICALPGGKEYGVLSIAIQLYAKASIEINVKRDSFIPSPNVDSAVVLLDVYKDIPYKIDETDFFFKVVKIAFSQRRKTIVNSLYSGFQKIISKDDIENILIQLNLKSDIRAERLSIEQFCTLSENLRALF